MKSYPWLFSALLSLAGECAFGSDPILWAVSDGGNGHYYEIVSLSGNYTEANDVADGLGFKGMAGKIVRHAGQILLKVTTATWEQLQIRRLWEKSGNPPAFGWT